MPCRERLCRMPAGKCDWLGGARAAQASARGARGGVFRDPLDCAVCPQGTNPDFVKSVARQVLGVLRVLRGINLVHCDIKASAAGGVGAPLTYRSLPPPCRSCALPPAPPTPCMPPPSCSELRAAASCRSRKTSCWRAARA